MATHYIENASSGNQYYFDASGNPVSQPHGSTQERSYTQTVTTTTTNVGSSDYSNYPAGVSGAHTQYQQIRSDRAGYDQDDSYQLAQQHQSVAGFNKNVSQQQYQSSPSPVPQVKASVRSVNIQEQQHSPQQHRQQVYTTYEQQGSSESPQYQQYHYESRQQSGQPANVTTYYQTPSSAQYTYQEADHQRTESPHQGRDHHTQAQQVTVRSMSSTTQPQQQQQGGSNYQQPQSYPASQISPQQSSQTQQYQDQIQQYYSQLTPEQYQQLLRQQQIQRQQQEEQRRQQLAQQQYYIQQQQERQTVDHHQPTPSNQESHHYDDYQQRRVYQTAPHQDQQPAQDQYDQYNQRSQHVQSTVSSNVNQDVYRQQQYDHQNQVDNFVEQQHRAAVQQSPSPSTYQQDQYRSTISIGGGQQASPNQQYQQHSESERQHQEEQDYYAVQPNRERQHETSHAQTVQYHQVTARTQPQQPQPQQQQQQTVTHTQQTVQPVGLRGLMSKFSGPTKIPTYESKSKLSSHTSTTRTTPIYTMTYSALPKSTEPPVNSAEYFEMLRHGTLDDSSSSSHQSGYPPHIQGAAPGFGALRDRFKAENVDENSHSFDDRYRQHQITGGNSSLASLRDQYINRAKDANENQDDSFSRRVQTVTQTVVYSNQSEPQQKQTTTTTTTTTTYSYTDDSQGQSENADNEQVDNEQVSSEGAVAEGGSTSCDSSIEKTLQ